MIQDYKGWVIQLIQQNNTWQVCITSPDGVSSKIGSLVGFHAHPETAILEAQSCIDRHQTEILLRDILEDWCDRALISWPEWEHLSASVTRWVIQH
ncbi:MAG: hypothetical protein LRZ84_27205 [Desertifilum sp.]|nr:hypothetical protein [Desertifilum sp.]